MSESEVISIWKNVTEEEPRTEPGNLKPKDNSDVADRGEYYLSGKQVVAIWCLCLVLAALMFVAGWMARGIVSDLSFVEHANPAQLPSSNSTPPFDDADLFPDTKTMLRDRLLSLDVPLAVIATDHVPAKSSFTILSGKFWRKRGADGLVVSIPESEYSVPKNASVRLLVDASPNKDDALSLAKRLNRNHWNANVFRMSDFEEKIWYVIAVDGNSPEHFMARENRAAFAAIFPTNDLRIVSLDENEEKIQIRKDNPHPYTLRLAAYRRHADTIKGCDIFKKRGLSVLMIGEIFSKGRVKWLYLYSGQYETTEAAEQAKKNDERLKGSIVTKAPYSILVKTPVSGNGSETISLLEKMGYFPYFLQGTEETRKLMVGVFSSKAEADGVRKKIAENGLECEVVER